MSAPLLEDRRWAHEACNLVEPRPRHPRPLMGLTRACLWRDVHTQHRLADQADVTVAWPARNMVNKSPPALAMTPCFSAACLARATRWPALSQCSHTPFAGCWLHSRPAAGFLDPPRHPYVPLCRAQCADSARQAPEHCLLRLLADTTSSTVLSSRTTMLKSRLRHRLANASGPLHVSVVHLHQHPRARKSAWVSAALI